MSSYFEVDSSPPAKKPKTADLSFWKKKGKSVSSSNDDDNDDHHHQKNNGGGGPSFFGLNMQMTKNNSNSTIPSGGFLSSETSKKYSSSSSPPSSSSSSDKNNRYTKQRVEKAGQKFGLTLQETWDIVNKGREKQQQNMANFKMLVRKEVDRAGREPTIILTDVELEEIQKRYPDLPMTVEEWSRRFNVTTEERKNISCYEQGSIEWLLSRYLIVSGTRNGPVATYTDYPETPETILEDMLFGRVMRDDGILYCWWGNLSEDFAAQEYCDIRQTELEDEVLASGGPRKRVSVQNRGLEIHRQEKWSGDSKDGTVVVETQQPDGSWKVTERGLLEIKCPARLEVYQKIPKTYYAQIQAIMGYNGFDWCDFVVWTPEDNLYSQDAIQIERYPFDREFFLWMHSKIRRWYVTELAPRAIYYEHNPDRSQDEILAYGKKEERGPIKITEEYMKAQGLSF